MEHQNLKTDSLGNKGTSTPPLRKALKIRTSEAIPRSLRSTLFHAFMYGRRVSDAAII